MTTLVSLDTLQPGAELATPVPPAPLYTAGQRVALGTFPPALFSEITLHGMGESILWEGQPIRLEHYTEGFVIEPASVPHKTLPPNLDRACWVREHWQVAWDNPQRKTTEARTYWDESRARALFDAWTSPEAVAHARAAEKAWLEAIADLPNVLRAGKARQDAYMAANLEREARE